ncbi:MAG: hypothetical protein KGL39_45460 [Patescibacteria group bacterium]|nr:hypothetical protein [Patescibacteria group bacterium]
MTAEQAGMEQLMARMRQDLRVKRLLLVLTGGVLLVIGITVAIDWLYSNLTPKQCWWDMASWSPSVGVNWWLSMKLWRYCRNLRVAMRHLTAMLGKLGPTALEHHVNQALAAINNL